MNSNWSPSDKIVGKKAVERAISAAEADIMKRFRNYSIKGVADLWKLEQDLQRWRRDIHGKIYLHYESLEDRLPEWIRNKWLTLSDISSLSAARLERIKNALK